MIPAAEAAGSTRSAASVSPGGGNLRDIRWAWAARADALPLPVGWRGRDGGFLEGFYRPEAAVWDSSPEAWSKSAIARR